MVNTGLSSSKLSLAKPSDNKHFSLTGTTEFGTYSSTASPEGSLVANVGSVCHDTVNGNIYKKKTGSGNTGWVELASNSNNVVAFRASIPSYTGAVTGNGEVHVVKNYTIDFETNPGSLNPTTGVFTAPESGVYLFNASISIASLRRTPGFVYVRINDGIVSLNQSLLVAISPTVSQQNDNFIFEGGAQRYLNKNGQVTLDVSIKIGITICSLGDIIFNAYKLY